MFRQNLQDQQDFLNLRRGCHPDPGLVEGEGSHCGIKPIGTLRLRLRMTIHKVNPINPV